MPHLTEHNHRHGPGRSRPRPFKMVNNLPFSKGVFPVGHHLDTHRLLVSFGQVSVPHTFNSKKGKMKQIVLRASSQFDSQYFQKIIYTFMIHDNWARLISTLHCRRVGQLVWNKQIMFQERKEKDQNLEKHACTQENGCTTFYRGLTFHRPPPPIWCQIEVLWNSAPCASIDRVFSWDWWRISAKKNSLEFTMLDKLWATKGHQEKNNQVLLLYSAVYLFATLHHMSRAMRKGTQN